METKLSDAECEERGWMRWAFLDYDEWHLYWGNEDGEEMQEIHFPKDWPEWISVEFVTEQGFTVEF